MRIFLFVLTCLLTGCGSKSGPPLLATDIEIIAPRPGMTTSAAYLTLTNNSDEHVRITTVSSPQYGIVEMHESAVENDVARMRKVHELVINPNEALRLQRGGIHLMLMQPVADIETVTLNLYDGDMLLMSLQTSFTVAGH